MPEFHPERSSSSSMSTFQCHNYQRQQTRPCYWHTMPMHTPRTILQTCRPLFSTAARRGYAMPARGPPNLQVFNRNTKWLQKEKAATDVDASRRTDYLRDEVAARLCERLLVYNYSTCYLYFSSSSPPFSRTSTAASTTSSTTAQTPATSPVP